MLIANLLMSGIQDPAIITRATSPRAFIVHKMLTEYFIAIGIEP